MRVWVNAVCLAGILAVILSAALTAAADGETCFVGDATATVRTQDAFGQWLEPEVYVTQTLVIVDDPAQFDSTMETNPFNLSIGPYPFDAPVGQGHFSLVSAVPLRDFDGSGFLAQYWEYALLKDVYFKGKLTDTHTAESLNQNFLWLEVAIAPGLTTLFPVDMALETRVQGRFSDANDRLTLRIVGTSTDLATEFAIDIEAELSPC